MYPCATSCELRYWSVDVDCWTESVEFESLNGEPKGDVERSNAQWTSFFGVAAIVGEEFHNRLWRVKLKYHVAEISIIISVILPQQYSVIRWPILQSEFLLSIPVAPNYTLKISKFLIPYHMRVYIGRKPTCSFRCQCWACKVYYFLGEYDSPFVALGTGNALEALQAAAGR